ncbi:hypothetical protein [Blautia sp. MSJ-19]|uniref:hypothetical protein n=1 Tax=Blautia sp. MSJ-19 TaxID=2841517 RepID=UPI001C0F0BAF|nr:hypothetical protein [Blautia sp. MSJ-19]MBU5479841.1 hypothetical protein [Blautia sp. MSJ-19]
MKKSTALALTLTALFALSSSVSAETLNTAQPTGTHEVKGTCISSTNQTVYSVDIEWSNFEFTYNEGGKGAWDPTTHTYSEAVPAGWGDQKGTIKLTNHSNAQVNYTLTYEKDSNYKGVYMGTSKGGNLATLLGNVSSAEKTTYEEAPSKEIDIYPGGTLPKGTDSATLGTFTITLNTGN